VSCVASEAWPDLYCGMFDTHVGPLGRGRHRTVEFRFRCCVGEVTRVFLLLRYCARPGSFLRGMRRS
jgi:hypothetical protein